MLCVYGKFVWLLTGTDIESQGQCEIRFELWTDDVRRSTAIE
jgi:hypothetical protein